MSDFHYTYTQTHSTTHRVASNQGVLHLLDDVLEVLGTQRSGHFDQCAPPHVSHISGAVLQGQTHLQENTKLAGKEEEKDTVRYTHCPVQMNFFGSFFFLIC